MNNYQKSNLEQILKIGLIILTILSLIITILNFTYFTYQDMTSTESINYFLVNYVNKCLWGENILLYVFAIGYIIQSIKSKQEVFLKVSFSIFSILTSMIMLTLIINLLAVLFKII